MPANSTPASTKTTVEIVTVIANGRPSSNWRAEPARLENTMTFICSLPSLFRVSKQPTVIGGATNVHPRLEPALPAAGFATTEPLVPNIDQGSSRTAVDVEPNIRVVHP